MPTSVDHLLCIAVRRFYQVSQPGTVAPVPRLGTLASFSSQMSFLSLFRHLVFDSGLIPATQAFGTILLLTSTQHLTRAQRPSMLLALSLSLQLRPVATSTGDDVDIEGDIVFLDHPPLGGSEGPQGLSSELVAREPTLGGSEGTQGPSTAPPLHRPFGVAVAGPADDGVTPADASPPPLRSHNLLLSDLGVNAAAVVGGTSSSQAAPHLDAVCMVQGTVDEAEQPLPKRLRTSLDEPDADPEADLDLELEPSEPDDPLPSLDEEGGAATGAASPAAAAVGLAMGVAAAATGSLVSRKRQKELLADQRKERKAHRAAASSASASASSALASRVYPRQAAPASLTLPAWAAEVHASHDPFFVGGWLFCAACGTRHTGKGSAAAAQPCRKDLAAKSTQRYLTGALRRGAQPAQLIVAGQWPDGTDNAAFPVRPVYRLRWDGARWQFGFAADEAPSPSPDA